MLIQNLLSTVNIKVLHLDKNSGRQIKPQSSKFQKTKQFFLSCKSLAFKLQCLVVISDKIKCSETSFSGTGF